MSPGINRVGMRADYFMVVGIASEQRGDGSYVMTNNRLVKEVDYFTVTCPDCRVPCYVDEIFEKICPRCGLVCGLHDGEDSIEVLPIDEASYLRCNGGDSGVPALNDPLPQEGKRYDRKFSVENSEDPSFAGSA